MGFKKGVKIQVPNSKILEIDDVCVYFPIKKFGQPTQYVRAMDHVSFSIKKGEIFALVGESGSGKTTTAKTVVKINKPSSGRVLFEGQDVFSNQMDKKLYRRNVQMIFQNPFDALNPTHTIGSILERPFVVHDLVPKKLIKDEVCQLLEQVGLNPPEEFVNKFPHELSGGERQRVNIARAMAVNPKLVLADEPTSMLDVSIKMTIMNMLKKLRDEKGISFLYITHDLAGARYIGDRIGVMYAGVMVEMGPADDVIQQAYHPYTQLLRSAAPQPEKDFIQKDFKFSGDIPNLANPPSGCRFHPRCPQAEGRCTLEMPRLVDVGDGHLVRCVKYY